MKRKNFKLYIPILVASILVLYACNKKFLQKDPIGSYTPETVATKAGVEGLLIGAYSLLDGQGGAGGSWNAAASNWVWGGVCSDDAHKGSDPGDQPDIVSLMTWSESSTNSYNEAKWQTCYDGVQRSNEVLRVMRQAKDIDPADTLEISSEARFLRGHYMFELKKIFNNIPIIDESITYTASNWRVANDQDAWPFIEADFQYAFTNLPSTQAQVGRANKYAAEAYLAKAKMYQQKYADALPLLTDLIDNGTNAAGQKYQLVDKFNDNFNAATKNNSETVFAVQNSVNDGSTAANANAGDVLNFSYDPSAPVSCCGFYQPSFSLANIYKTDAVTGLPDPVHYNDADMTNDQGLKSTDPFTPYAGTVDPRLDWTVGRRGVPFLDWGPNPGYLYVRNQASGGPYTPVKNAPYLSQVGALTDKSSWTAGYTALNVNLIRFADVLLWAAEAEVLAPTGDLENARKYVNMVRARAANPIGWVNISQNEPGAYAVTNSPAAFSAIDANTTDKNIIVGIWVVRTDINTTSVLIKIDKDTKVKTWDNYPMPNYKIGLYTTPWTDPTAALTAVRFERRLELAMEGQRFFDLVRYGTADTELNAYVAHEVNVSGYNLIKGAVFKKGQSEYFAIPQAEIDASSIAGKPTLKQNPGY